MKCDFVEIGDIPDARGARRVRCRRCGLTLNKTASPLNRCRSQCTAWPEWWEAGWWIELLLAVFGIRKSSWNWLRRQMGFVKPCKCDQRIATLNESGGWLADRIEMVRAMLTTFREP